MSWKIYSDGACQTHTKIGGWGAVILKHKLIQYEIYGSEVNTTSSRMELTAVINSYRFLKSKNVIINDLEFVTDSMYVQKGASVYLEGWVAKNWRLSDHRPVKNRDLWESILTIKREIQIITWTWVKGHHFDAYNKKADLLAKNGISSLIQK